MKQTAVEWLVEELRKHEFLGTFCTPEELENKKKYVESIIEQAKEMEKEQILKACDFGRAYGYNQATGYPNPISNPEKYYNETFKSE